MQIPHVRIPGRLTLACLAAFAAAFSASAQVAPEHVALTGGRIVPIEGQPIDSGTILITRGRIAAVGEKVEVPYDARVFDVSGKTVFPGMIDPHTWRGLDVPNEARPVTPQLSAADAIDPSTLYFEDQLRLGHAALHVIQANNTIIGGLGLVVHPIGLSPSEMTIAEGAFLKLAVSRPGGGDAMVNLATLRDAFLELEDYLGKLAERRYEEKLKEEEKKMDVGPAEARRRGISLIRAEDLDDEHANLLRLRGGKVRFGDLDGPVVSSPLGAFIYCAGARDVDNAIEFAKSHGFLDRTVLVLDGDAHKAMASIKKAARPVVMPEDLVYREADPLTGKISETFVPAEFSKAGVAYSLTSGPNDSLPESMLNYQAARCVRNGVPRDEALRAITIEPAKALGLEDRLGSIEVGKVANLVVFSGDPLEFTSVVERVFIDGIPAYDRSKDIRLKRLLELDAPEAAGAPAPSSPETPESKDAPPAAAESAESTTQSAGDGG